MEKQNSRSLTLLSSRALNLFALGFHSSDFSVADPERSHGITRGAGASRTISLRVSDSDVIHILHQHALEYAIFNDFRVKIK